MPLLTTLAAALLATTGAAQEPPPQAGVAFVDLSLSDAISRAEREERLLLVFWASPSYRDVQRMRETTWTDRHLGRWVTANALAIEVDGPANPRDVGSYQVTAYPTTDLLDPSRGVGVERLQGHASADDLLAAFAGALVGGGPAPKPEGAALEDPYAWLAYANSMWRQPDGAEEAARAYGWALRNGDDHRPGFRRRYFEFLATRLAYLKPRAIEAFRVLDGERTIVEGRLYRGIVDARTVHELVRLDFWLRTEDRTRETFLELAGRDEAAEVARGHLLRYVLHDLGRRGELESILKALEGIEPAAWVRERFTRLEAAIARQAKGEPVLAEEVDSRADAVLGASWIYDALLGAGRGADADGVVDALAAEAPSGRAFALLVDRARDRGLHELALRVGRRGLTLISDGRGKRQLQRALAKVPGYVPDDEGPDDERPDDGGRDEGEPGGAGGPGVTCRSSSGR